MIAVIVKATLLVCVVLTALHFASHARAAVRHGILLATFVMLLALPAGAVWLPRIEWPILPAAANTPGRVEGAAPRAVQGTAPAPSAQAAVPHANAGAAVRFGLTGAALTIWLGGVAIVLLSLAIGIYRAQRLRRTALPALETRRLLSSLKEAAGVRARVEVMVHEQLWAPIACGVLRPCIVLPTDTRDWSDAELARALVHELEHVKRYDWATQVIARAVCAMYWFHPLVWMAYRRLCLEAEHACDDAVVAREESTTYAEQLVTLARRMTPGQTAAVLGMAQRSDLAARVTAVLDASRPRGRAGLLRTAMIAALATAATLSLAPLDLVAAASPAATLAASAGSVAVAPGAPGPSPGAQPLLRSSRLNRVLVEAADEGDLDEVRRLLDAGADVNAAVPGDGSPLIAAARNGRLSLVEFLLDRGADVNLPVQGDGSPLIMAAREGHLAIVQRLLDRGADVHLAVPDDENALIQASGGGHLAVVQLLVARGADVNARLMANGYGGRDAEWRSPLSMAVRGGHRAVVEFLRANGAVQ